MLKQKAENNQEKKKQIVTYESGLGGEISDGHWDLFDDVLTNHLNVVLKLSRDRNDGSSLCYCTCSTYVSHNN